MRTVSEESHRAKLADNHSPHCPKNSPSVSRPSRSLDVSSLALQAVGAVRSCGGIPQCESDLGGWLILLIGFAADAQSKCGMRTGFVKSLEGKYGEVNKGLGLTGNGSGVVELWASDEAGTFSIFVTYPDGVSCLLAVGQGWMESKGAAQNGEGCRHGRTEGK